MCRHALSLRRTFWVVAYACLLLLPRLAPGAPARGVDVEVVDQHEHVALARHDASILSVWLSGPTTVQNIRSRGSLAQVAATELDGVRRLALVAPDSTSPLHVWERKHSVFQPYRSDRGIPATVDMRGRRDIGGGDADSTDSLSDASFAWCALCPHWSPRALRVDIYVVRALPRAPTTVAWLAEPFAPRPPPTLIQR